MPKRGGVHDPSRDEREEPGDDKRTGENKHHDAAMIRNPVTVRHPQAEWKRHQREDRRQMDRAPGAHQPDLMDPERTDSHRYHQANPEPADRDVFPAPRDLDLDLGNFKSTHVNAVYADVTILIIISLLHENSEIWL
jgi:hypothetical protein